MERYGHRLTSQWGDAPPASWRAELGALSRESLKRGIDALRARVRIDPDGRHGWPPSLDEFLALCVERTPPPAHKAFPPALPLPPKLVEARRQRGLAAIQAMKELLRSKRSTTDQSV
ncbi:MAG: hypothetical protein ACPGVG_19475 [Mycobacterium sp.]